MYTTNGRTILDPPDHIIILILLSCDKLLSPKMTFCIILRGLPNSNSSKLKRSLLGFAIIFRLGFKEYYEIISHPLKVMRIL